MVEFKSIINQAFLQTILNKMEEKVFLENKIKLIFIFSNDDSYSKKLREDVEFIEKYISQIKKNLSLNQNKKALKHIFILQNYLCQFQKKIDKLSYPLKK